MKEKIIKKDNHKWLIGYIAGWLTAGLFGFLSWGLFYLQGNRSISTAEIFPYYNTFILGMGFGAFWVLCYAVFYRQFAPVAKWLWYKIIKKDTRELSSLV